MKFSVEVDEGSCKKSVVKLDEKVATICLVLNCVPGLSGIGTCVSACIGKDFNGLALIFGILQWFLTWFIVGFIWSVLHGVWIYQKAHYSYMTGESLLGS